MKYKIEYENNVKELLKDKKYTYYIETMGCVLNENDSMKYSGILEVMGFSKAETINTANIVIFNTCCIRESAEDKLLGKLGALKNRKKSSKDVYICIVGCMMEQGHILEKIQKSYSFVDVILGTKNMQSFAKLLYISMTGQKSNFELSEGKDEIIENIPIIYEKGFKATISIIYGCNNFCSYCIVPYVRGRERSREPLEILKDVKEVAKKGYKEITLLGQNVNSYGGDFKGTYKGYNFIKLLSEVEKIEGIEIIRFMSPHPKDFTEELIEFLSRSKKTAKQIHLPLQSGSTKVLKEMNRKYTKEQYLDLVERIKEKVSNVSFSTDIIVGFPGETKDDFEQTLDVVEKVHFDAIYMFCYSKRKGTVAEKLKNQVDEDVKVKRLQKLKKLSDSIAYEQKNLKVGLTEKILVEGKSKKNDKIYTGRTTDNKIVVFEAEEEDVGKIIDVNIIKNNKWYLTGEKTK